MTSELNRNIGFIQGITYAAAMIKSHDFDAYDLIKASGISTSNFKKHGNETDIEILQDELNSINLE